MIESVSSPIVGIGYGPANLALAIDLEKSGLLSEAVFLERRQEFGWQSQQLIPGADIQNNPLRDLGLSIEDEHVSFLGYLQDKGRLLEYLHLNSGFPSRVEYADYLSWAAGQIPAQVNYGTGVGNVAIVTDPVTGAVRFAVDDEAGRRCYARTLVLGTGRSPRIPAVFGDCPGTRVSHASRFADTLVGVDLRGSVTAVVGSSQSAIEIAIHLIKDCGVRTVVLIHRGIGFRLKDTSPYSRRVFLPEFVDYFHPLPRGQRQQLRRELRSVNYGACDADVIATLAALEYADSVAGTGTIERRPFSEVVAAQEILGRLELTVADRFTGGRTLARVDHVVLATGYRDFGDGVDDEPVHPLLGSVIAEFVTHDDGVPVVARDYSLVPVPGGTAEQHGLGVFLNGLCEESHGMGDAGALAMVAYRARDIGRALAAQASIPAAAGL